MTPLRWRAGADEFAQIADLDKDTHVIARDTGGGESTTLTVTLRASTMDKAKAAATRYAETLRPDLFSLPPATHHALTPALRALEARLRELLAKATPGPWRRCGASDNKCSCGLVWSGPLDDTIGRFYMATDDHDIGSEAMNANVSLTAEGISALPALLDALAQQATAREEVFAEGWRHGRGAAADAVFRPWNDLGDRPSSPPAAVINAQLRILDLKEPAAPTEGQPALGHPAPTPAERKGPAAEGETK